MQGPDRKRCSNGAINTSVLGAGVVAFFVAPGAVYCTEKVFPQQMGWLKRQFAEHFVEPHIGVFRKFSSGLRRAHEKYDARMRENLINKGEPIPAAYLPSTDLKQESYAIADAWVTGMLAITADLAATYGSLKMFNRFTAADNKAGSLSLFDTGTSLLGMAAMPTVFAGFAENANHKISRVLRKFGMSKEDAENISVPTTYVQFPALVALLGSLVFAHKTNGK